jgi:hypothetical protein
MQRCAQTQTGRTGIPHEMLSAQGPRSRLLHQDGGNAQTNRRRGCEREKRDPHGADPRCCFASHHNADPARPFQELDPFVGNKIP